jgi:hypothetical protein
MLKRLMRWFTGTVLILVLVSGVPTNGGQPSVTHAEGQPTPTATVSPEGEPGGNGGGRN